MARPHRLRTDPRPEQRRDYCSNGHPKTGETKAERDCRPCRLMRLKRHRLNNTPSAEGRRASQRAYRAREVKVHKPPKPPPPKPKRLVCGRGHDQTDPANLTYRGECKPCRHFVDKMRLAGEPIQDMRRRENLVREVRA